MQKKVNKSIWNEIEKILNSYWDPIGVNEDFNARGEYSAYVGGLYKLVFARIKEHDLEDYLRKIEREVLEIESSDEKRAETIKKLMQIHKKIKS